MVVELPAFIPQVLRRDDVSLLRAEGFPLVHRHTVLIAGIRLSCKAYPRRDSKRPPPPPAKMQVLQGILE